MNIQRLVGQFGQPRIVAYYRMLRVDVRSLAAFIIPFTIYLLTLAPTVYNLDSAELTTAAATGGIVRATGYPLYLVLGHLWSHIPIGDVGYRMNLFSAFHGALTIFLAERILRRWEVGPWATFAALGLLATAPMFWALSLIAEVYTLHTALMAGLILLLLRWAERPTAGRLAAVALVSGMSASHHAATALLVPGCVWFVCTTAPRQALRVESLLPALVALVIGMSAYLYLPLRYMAHPDFNYAGTYNATGVFEPVNLQTLEGIWWLVSGRVFMGHMLAYDWSERWDQTVLYLAQLWRSFFVIGIGPGLVGLIVMLRRNWRVGGMLLLFFLVNAAFYIDYWVIDKETMFLPTYLVWALWVGVGYEWLFRWTCATDWVQDAHRAAYLFPSVAVGAVVVALVWTWNMVDLSDDRSARQRGEAILTAAEPDALIFGWWETVPVIEYLQLVEGQRPDVQPINRFLISYTDMRSMIARSSDDRPVYIDTPSGSLLRQWRIVPTGALYAIQPRHNRDSVSDGCDSCR